MELSPKLLTIYVITWPSIPNLDPGEYGSSERLDPQLMQAVPWVVRRGPHFPLVAERGGEGWRQILELSGDDLLQMVELLHELLQEGCQVDGKRVRGRDQRLRFTTHFYLYLTASLTRAAVCGLKYGIYKVLGCMMKLSQWASFPQQAAQTWSLVHPLFVCLIGCFTPRLTA